jgi:predicted aspartyl protease
MEGESVGVQMRVIDFVRIPGVIAIAVAALLSGSMPCLAAPDYLGAGINCMRKSDFRSALGYLGQAYRSDPNNPEIAKLMAICYQSLKDSANAQKWAKYYISMSQRSSSSATVSTPAASAAATHGTSGLYSGGSSGAADLSRLPDQCRIPFEKDQGLLFINAYFNNRPLRMVFDTGAEVVALGKNHLRELGINAPEGKPIGQASGVGSTSGVNVWDMRMNVKVGSIERPNFRCMIQESMPTPPLLGQSFFRDFEYTIDYNGSDKEHGNICFTKKGSNLASAASMQASGYSVPFQREGNEMVVTATINGKPYPMFFDTGASGCTFSEKQLQELNIQIPDDAVVEQHIGIGGATTGHRFAIQSLRLGPIDKRDMQISATHASNMRHPLLGQTFYGDWQYTIDNAKSVINFVRR